jgi:tetratricopeptide (TPR) repeat protein
MEVAVGLCWFWLKRGYFREGQEWLERALSAGHAASAVLRAKTLMNLGMLTFFQGDFVRTQALVDESAALGQTAGDLSVVAFSLGVCALTALERGDAEACARLAVEGQAAARRSAMPWIQGMSVSCLAYLALQQGDFDRASALHEEVLELSRERGEKWAMGITLFDLALLRVIQDRHEEARAMCAEGIALNQEFGDRRGIAWCLGILSAAEAAEGRHLQAARLRGAMEGLLESVGAPIQASYNHSIGDRSLEAMKSGLGDREFHAAVDEGRALSLSRAIQLGISAMA